MEFLLMVMSGLVMGVLSGFLVWRRCSTRAADLQAVIASKDQEMTGLRLKLTETEIRAAEREQAAAERLKLYEESQKHHEETEAEMTERFKALTTTALSESLERSQKMIAELAADAFKKQSEAASTDLGERVKQITSLMMPLTEAVTKIKAGNESTAEALGKQIKNLADSQRAMIEATANLKAALKTPALAGKFGEDHLQRLLDTVGLIQGTHYVVKPSMIHPDTGDKITPDLVVNFPDGTNLVIDSKFPMTAYLAATEAPTQNERDAHLKKHVLAFKDHIRDLSNTGYERATKGYGFTVMFCANEGGFLAALHADSDLHAYALSKKILIASPTTLLFILNWMSHHWKSNDAVENIKAIQEAAISLNTVLPNFLAEYNRVGVALKTTVKAFNESAETLDDQVIVHAKDMERLGIPFAKKLTPAKRIRSKIQTLTEGVDPYEKV